MGESDVNVIGWRHANRATRAVCYSGTDSNSGLRADEVGPLLEIKAHPLIQAS